MRISYHFANLVNLISTITVLSYEMREEGIAHPTNQDVYRWRKKKLLSKASLGLNRPINV